MSYSITTAALEADWVYDPDGTGTAASGYLVIDSGTVSLHQTDADSTDQSGTDLTVLHTPVLTLATYAGTYELLLDALAVDSGRWTGTVVEEFGIEPEYASKVTVSISQLGMDAKAVRVPVNELASSVRYGSLSAVKAKLGVSTTAKDTRLTQALIAAEIQIDRHLGAGFSGTIPKPIVEAAENIAMAVYKAGDSPTGTMGSDDWIGTIDVSEEVRREFQRNSMLVGFRESWGIA